MSVDTCRQESLGFILRLPTTDMRASDVDLVEVLKERSMLKKVLIDFEKIALNFNHNSVSTQDTTLKELTYLKSSHCKVKC